MISYETNYVHDASTLSEVHVNEVGHLKNI